MSYNLQMKKCEEYISANLGKAITAGELASVCGYSLYHFCRVFKAFYNTSPAEHIRKIKLKNAAEDIVKGKDVLNTALEYGYETHAGFTKAFLKEYGISPTNYKKLINTGGFIMNYQIKNIDSFKVFGYLIEADYEKGGAFWKNIDFSKYPKYPENCDDQGEVAMWIHPEEVSGELKYFFGYKTGDSEVPEGFSEIVIPAAKYAVFEVDKASNAEELAKTIDSAWKQIFSEWFENNEYKFDENNICFEFYKADNAYIYVPVV